MSPDLAAPTPLPVTAVTLLEDRAQVERTATLRLEPGVRRLCLGPVSALAADRTLHAELDTDTASVLDARIVRTWTPRGPEPGPGDSALRVRVHELREERDELTRRRERLRVRLDLAERLAADLLREIGECTGYGEADPERWAAELDRADEQRDTWSERLLAVEQRLAVLARELQEAEAALADAERNPAELTGHVELTVEAEVAGTARLRLTHLTACALWRPAYRAVLDGDTLTLETDAMVWQRTGEDWSDVRLAFSTARSALSTEPPPLTEDRLRLTDRTREERRTVHVELREETVSALDRRSGGTTGLPGVDDGGRTRVLRAPAPVSVPSDGRAHRVPVSVARAAARGEYACVPELSPLVTHVVRCDNPAGHALLAGPVDLVGAGGFGGRGTLEFTAPGAPLRLAFGSHDDFRVVREVEEERDTASVSQRTTLTRTVRLHLSRFSAPGEEDDRTVTVRERVPVSEVSAVRVGLREEACSPVPDEVDADGIARWDVTLPPGGRRTLTLVYEVIASGRVTGL